MQRVAIIMAGGIGERFWPVSRPDRPKQLLRLSDSGKTMIEDAVDRLTPIIDPQHILIATSDALKPIIESANTEVPANNVVAEPAKRNTAGCLVWASAHLLARHPDPRKVCVAVVTADHIIGEPDRFAATVDAAMSCSESLEMLVTHGIVPTRPDTGYGYIQADEREDAIHTSGDIPIFRVTTFHEKPDLEDAETYVERGDCYWNAGMFFWRFDTFLSELMLAQPAMGQAIYKIADAIREEDAPGAAAAFEAIDSISIDYALLEKSPNVAVARATYPWDDVGSWASLNRIRATDADGNVVEGDAQLTNCSDTTVYVDGDAVDVRVVGAEGMVVVVSDGKVLVVPKDRIGEIPKPSDAGKGTE